MALGVFVAEAHERSGSLITARQSLDQGKDVFALPGPVDRLTSRGAHRLIKEGACLVESPEEILGHLRGSLETFQSSIQPELPMLAVDDFVGLSEKEADLPAFGEVNALETEIIGLLKEKRELCLDEISNEMQKSIDVLMPAITILELKRMIHKEPTSKYSLNFDKGTCERSRNKA